MVFIIITSVYHVLSHTDSLVVHQLPSPTQALYFCLLLSHWCHGAVRMVVDAFKGRRNWIYPIAREAICHLPSPYPLLLHIHSERIRLKLCLQICEHVCVCACCLSPNEVCIFVEVCAKCGYYWLPVVNFRLLRFQTSLVYISPVFFFTSFPSLPLPSSSASSLFFFFFLLILLFYCPLRISVSKINPDDITSRISAIW